MLTASVGVDIADKTPPTSFRIFRAGLNDSDYGPFMFDALASERVMTAYVADGKPLCFDYNHGTMKPYATAEEGKSAGGFVPAIVDGELHATQIEWTPEASRRIADGEYRLFSPAFEWTEDSDGYCRPAKLINCALVNRPGLKNIDTIAASGAANMEDADMTVEEMLRQKTAELEAANAEIARLKATRGDHVVALAASLGAPTTAQVAELAAAASDLSGFRRDVIALTGKPTAAESLGVIMSWRESHGQVAQLMAAREAEAQVARDKEFVALLDGAVEKKIIAPAFRKDFWEAQHAPGGKATAAGIAMLRAYVGSNPAPIVGAAGSLSQPQGGGTSDGSIGTTVGRQLSQNMNIDETAFQKWQAENAAKRAAGTMGIR